MSLFVSAEVLTKTKCIIDNGGILHTCIHFLTQQNIVMSGLHGVKCLRSYEQSWLSV